MTKEELEKEAEKYFKSICGDYNEEYERTGKRHYWVGFDIKNAYLASAEPREKRIAELEEENKELKEKLKPENCLKLLAKEGYIKFTSDQLTYAKTIIQDLLDNTDEYARQRAEDFLKECE